MTSAGELPAGLRLVRTTATFDEHTVPSGLLGAHHLAVGVWGRLVVVGGSVEFVFEDDPGAARVVEAGSDQVIPPGRRHHIVVHDGARFRVEFHR